MTGPAFEGATWHDSFARCPECGHATVGLSKPYAINHSVGCSMPPATDDEGFAGSTTDHLEGRIRQQLQAGPPVGYHGEEADAWMAARLVVLLTEEVSGGSVDRTAGAGASVPDAEQSAAKAVRERSWLIMVCPECGRQSAGSARCLNCVVGYGTRDEAGPYCVERTVVELSHCRALEREGIGLAAIVRAMRPQSYAADLVLRRWDDAVAALSSAGPGGETADG